MGLVGDPIPPRPSGFSAHDAPPGVAVDFEAFRRNDGIDGPWFEQRPTITPTTQVVHTNAAGGEGDLQSQINFSNAAPNNTHAHYNVNAPQPTKHCPTDRRAIGNSTAKPAREAAGVRDSSFWSIVIETADSGTDDDPQVSDFLHDHAEIVARILAYESIVWDIPLAYPATWTEPGTITHTEPFGFPFFTTRQGKTCPGGKKKTTVRNEILPRAREIRAAWLDETPSASDLAPEVLPEPVPAADVPKVTVALSMPVIRLGDHGREVKQMQHLLASAGYLDERNSGNYDGTWADGTDRAKEQFDIDHGLHTPGDTSCGPKSWESLLTRRRW